MIAFLHFSYLFFSLLYLTFEVPPWLLIDAVCVQNCKMSGEEFPDSQGITFQSRRQDESPPDVRLLHYNDVYHIEYVKSEHSLILGPARVVLSKE